MSWQLFELFFGVCFIYMEERGVRVKRLSLPGLLFLEVRW